MSTRITDWAPIGLFIYKRPEHTRRVITSLQACEGVQSSPIYVFADGPRSEADVPAVEATRAVARELLDGRATIVQQVRNRGLADSIIAGTTQLCDRYGTAIVIEDDLLLAPSFLRFINEGLERYRNEPRVMQVSGHMFDVPAFALRQEALFLSMTTSWGWGTWKRAWDQFDPLATGWRERLADVAEAKRFNLDGSYDYLRMLKRQMTGGIDSWAIRWYYAAFANHGLALFPPRTLVSNIGLDGSGTHARVPFTANQAPLEFGTAVELPSEVEESNQRSQVFDAIRAFHRTSAMPRLRALVGMASRRLRSHSRVENQ